MRKKGDCWEMRDWQMQDWDRKVFTRRALDDLIESRAYQRPWGGREAEVTAIRLQLHEGRVYAEFSLLYLLCPEQRKKAGDHCFPQARTVELAPVAASVAYCAGAATTGGCRNWQTSWT